MANIFSRLLRYLWWLVALQIVLLALLMGAARALLPLANNFQTDIEAWLTAELQHPVEIERLDVRWSGLGPEFSFEGFNLVHPDGHAPLFAAQQIIINTSLWDLFSNKRLGVQGITVVGVDLDIRRVADRHWQIQGQDINFANNDTDNIADQDIEHPHLLDQMLGLVATIQLEDSQISLSDAKGAFANYTFSQLHAALGKTANTYKVYAEASLPESLGEHLRAAIEYTPASPELPRPSLRAHVNAKAIQIAGLEGFFPEMLYQPKSGALNTEFWLDWGQQGLAALTGQVELTELAVTNRSAGKKSVWTLNNLSGRGRWQRKNSGWDLVLEDFSTNATIPAEPNYLRIEYRQQADGHSHIAGHVDQLNISELSNFDVLLPASSARVFKKLKPAGEIKQLRFHKPLDEDLQNLRLTTRVENYSQQAWQKIPSVAGISGKLVAAAGQLRVDIEPTRSELGFSGLFRQPLKLDQIDGSIGMSFNNDLSHFKIWSPELRLSNAHLQTVNRLNANWQQQSGLFIDMQARIEHVDARFTPLYLPTGIMPDDLTSWLDTSVLSGTVNRGDFLLYGYAKDFPYSKADGVFLVDFDTQKLQLKYADDWPAINQLNSRVRFYGPGLSLRSTQGLIRGASITNLALNIDDLESGKIVVEADIDAKMPHLLSFIARSPIGSSLSRRLIDTKASGNTPMSLDMVFQLQNMEQSKVNGKLKFDDAAVLFKSLKLDIKNIRGDINFTEAGLSTDSVLARLNGRTLNISASNSVAQGTSIVGAGKLSVTELLGANYNYLNPYVQGRDDWKLFAELPPFNQEESKKNPRFIAESAFEAMHVKLPEPFAKKPGVPAPVRAVWQYGEKPNLRELLINYVDHTRIRAEFIDSELEWQLQRGGLYVNSGHAQLPKSEGLQIRADVPFVDVNRWLNFANNSKGDSKLIDRVTRFKLKTPKLHYAGIKAKQFNVDANRRNDVWQLSSSSNLWEGTATVPIKKMKTVGVKVALDRLDVSNIKLPKSQTEPDLRPNDIPPLDIRIDELISKDGRFYNVTAVAQPSANQLMLDVGFNSPNLSLRAGRILWSAGGRKHSTEVTFSVHSDNWGEGFADVGSPDLMYAGDGSISGSFEWPGPLYDLDVTQLGGAVNISLADGSLLDADPGAGRLVGLLSIQALPQRLFLDFSDMTQDGFPFDKIRGSLQIQAGIATTKDLAVKGTIGKIDVSGTTDLVNKTYDQKIIVRPEFGATLPVISELAIPGSGLAVLVVGAILETLGFETEGEYIYTLTGPWDNPEMLPVIPPVEPDQQPSLPRGRQNDK